MSEGFYLGKKIKFVKGLGTTANEWTLDEVEQRVDLLERVIFGTTVEEGLLKKICDFETKIDEIDQTKTINDEVKEEEVVKDNVVNQENVKTKKLKFNLI